MTKIRLVLVLILALGTPLAPGASAAATQTVVLTDEAPYFHPRRLRVERGTTVTWRNEGPALTHTIFFVGADGAVHSGPLPPHQTWSHRFATDAVVRTSCEIHPYMYGILVVGHPSDALIKAVEATATTPAHGAVSTRILEFPLPVPNSVPGIIALDANDNAWFTMGGGGWGNINHPPLPKFGRLTLDGDISVYSTPTAESGPSGLLVAPDQTIYITELMAGKIAHFDPRTRNIDEFDVPTNPAWPTGLALSQGGELWFNETKGNKVGTLHANGHVSEIAVPTAGAHPTGMVIDHAGTVWIAERDGGKIARIGAGESFVEMELETPKVKPAGMTLDPSGRVWVAEREGNRLLRVDADGIKAFALPNPHSGPMFMTADVAGNIWFSEVYADRIGVFVPALERFVEFAVPTPDSWPGGVAFDRQGNLWFTEQLANKVGVLLEAQTALAQALSAEATAESGMTMHGHR